MPSLVINTLAFMGLVIFITSLYIGSIMWLIEEMQRTKLSSFYQREYLQSVYGLISIPGVNLVIAAHMLWVYYHTKKKEIYLDVEYAERRKTDDYKKHQETIDYIVYWLNGKFFNTSNVIRCGEGWPEEYPDIKIITRMAYLNEVNFQLTTPYYDGSFFQETLIMSFDISMTTPTNRAKMVRIFEVHYNQYTGRWFIDINHPDYDYQKAIELLESFAQHGREKERLILKELQQDSQTTNAKVKDITDLVIQQAQRINATNKTNK